MGRKGKKVKRKGGKEREGSKSKSLGIAPSYFVTKNPPLFLLM